MIFNQTAYYWDFNMTGNNFSVENLGPSEAFIYIGPRTTVTISDLEMFHNYNLIENLYFDPIMIFCDSCVLTIDLFKFVLQRYPQSAFIIAKDASSVTLKRIDFATSGDIPCGKLIKVIGDQAGSILIDGIDLDTKTVLHKDILIKITRNLVFRNSSAYGTCLRLIYQLPIREYKNTIKWQNVDELKLSYVTIALLQSSYQFLNAQGGQNIVIDHLQLNCQLTSFEIQLMDYEYFKQVTDNTVIEQYFDLNYQSPIQINNVNNVNMQWGNMRNCYNQQRGGIFTFINSTVVDYNTTFQQNLAMSGSAIYCEDCKMTLTNTYINYQVAMRGAAIYLNGSSTVEFIDMWLEQLYAYDKGGFLYVEQSKNLITNNEGQSSESSIDNYLETESKISFTRGNFLALYALNAGGGLFIDSELMEIDFTNIYQQTSNSKNGGFIYLQNAKSLTIADSNFRNYQGYNGACIQSESADTVISIERSNFQQNSDPIHEDPRDQNPTVDYSNDLYGAIYIKKAESVTFKNNKFYNHYYKKYGAVAFLEQTKYYDIGSTYFNTLSGTAAIYFNQTYDVELSFLIIEENMSLIGTTGLHFEQVNGDVKLTNVTIFKSAGQQAAIYYQNYENPNSLVPNQLLLTNVSIINSDSQYYGGIYFYHPTGVFISRNLFLNYVTSGFLGVIVIQSARMVEFHDSIVRETRSAGGSVFLYANNIKESAYIGQIVIFN
ncbi:UNKNOWN [Stylonychia lemnae]|uniref:Right handed beta helix domain-containing protein n=1 Tax=Stylonychia lemnae TaxID=5949 RepID=A0A078AD74_STYLE|nr:UNKNOWN [Stylonychia lemnae]|eukprot:CDW78818.1 UNKNOWN [Stylonychia lemnae]